VSAPESALVEDAPEPAQPVVPTMEPLELHEIELREGPELSEVDQGVKTLVNLDDITDVKQSPAEIKAAKEKVEKEPFKSKPLPPTKPEWHLGMNPRLGDIKEHAPAKEAPAREIMRTHAFDPRAAQAGMMVVYGATMPMQPQYPPQYSAYPAYPPPQYAYATGY